MSCPTESLPGRILLIVSLAFSVICQVELASAQEAAKVNLAGDWITDPTALLSHLKRRDAEFDNRSLQIDLIWIERVFPKAQIAKARGAALRFGQPAPAEESADSVPADFDQPHRVRQLLTVRESEVTLERVADLEKMKHPRFVALPNKGSRWSTVGGEERSYSPETNSLHLMGKPKAGVLQSSQWMFEWCCGYGLAKRMKSIESVRVEGELIFIEAKAQLMDYDDTRISLELDRDYIVRHANVVVPVQIGTGFNKYVVETTGTERPEGSPPIAKRGHYQRILQPVGKSERLYKEYDVAFVNISTKLTDEQYSERTAIEPPDDVSIVDFRPRDQRK